jgi:YidC/Oxa1 family membrane protein insertase
MPKPESDPNDQAANTMKSMNIMMPAMSAVFCFSLPSGMGLYWIVGAIVRIVQQILINKHIDKMDIDAMIDKNSEKAKEKAEKRKAKNSERSDRSSDTAARTRRTTANRDSRLVTRLTPSEEARIDEMNQTRKQKTYKKDSLSYHADMVRRFNEFGNEASDSE